MTEKVLIAGGLGFIGSNLIKKLLELKYQVFVLIVILVLMELPIHF